MIKLVTDISKFVSFNYFIEARYEAGVVLLGWEVKCIRLNGVDLSTSFVSFRNSLVLIVGTVVNSSSFVSSYDFLNEKRDKVLLLNKKEINFLSGFSRMKGYTIIPSKAYWKNNLFKIEICLCFGKKKYDKRTILKNRELNLACNRFE
jgi:SsrA-binding protein